MSARVALLSGLMSLVVATRAQADELAECVDSAADVLRERGAVVDDDSFLDFLVEGESRTLPLALEDATCIGVLAVGNKGVLDLDLVLSTQSGIEVAADLALERHAYVRFCGAADVRLAATIRMFGGRGEVRAIVLRDAPTTLPDLNRVVGDCFAAVGGRRLPPPPIGPPAAAASATHGLAAAREALEAAGYAASGGAQNGALTTDRPATGFVQLGGGRCHAITVASGGAVQSLDLFVRTPDGAPVAREGGQPMATVRFCAEASGNYLFELRSFSGAGDFALQPFTLAEPPGPLPVGLDGLARIPYAETVARMAAHGMRAEPVGWGWAEPGRSLTFPIELADGRCYAVAAVPAPETFGTGLRLTLRRDRHHLVGTSAVGAESPTVLHCADRPALYQAQVEELGGRGRFLLLLGVDDDAPSGGGP